MRDVMRIMATVSAGLLLLLINCGVQSEEKGDSTLRVMSIAESVALREIFEAGVSIPQKINFDTNIKGFNESSDEIFEVKLAGPDKNFFALFYVNISQNKVMIMCYPNEWEENRCDAANKEGYEERIFKLDERQNYFWIINKDGTRKW